MGSSDLHKFLEGGRECLWEVGEDVLLRVGLQGVGGMGERGEPLGEWGEPLGEWEKGLPPTPEGQRLLWRGSFYGFCV
jgi:hypothetical protein